MLFLLLGPNSFEAHRKIKEIEGSFLKKNASAFVERVDGETDPPERIENEIKNVSLLFKKRLVVCKNVLASIARQKEFFVSNGPLLKNSPDIFVWWERDASSKNKGISDLKKIAARTQMVSTRSFVELKRWAASAARARNVSIDSEAAHAALAHFAQAPAHAEWAISNFLDQLSLSNVSSEKHGARVLRSFNEEGVFQFADRIAGSRDARVLVVLREAEQCGIAPGNLVNVLFWKHKRSRLTSKSLDMAWHTLTTDSLTKRESAIAGEHVERLALTLLPQQGERAAI